MATGTATSPHPASTAVSVSSAPLVSDDAHATSRMETSLLQEEAHGVLDGCVASQGTPNRSPCVEVFIPHRHTPRSTPIPLASTPPDDMCVDEDEDNSVEEDDGGDPGLGPSHADQGRKFRSEAWKEFVKIRVAGVVMQAECKHCATRISAKRGAGTSALIKHLNRCKARKKANKVVDRLRAAVLSPDGVALRNWTFDQDVSRRELVRMIVLHELPFSLVEYDGFRKFVSSLNPLFKMISRRTLKKDCLKLFEEQKLELQEMFRSCTSRVSLTMDMWTSNQTIGYMCITCHFVDASWKIQKRILRFSHLETPHTGVAMFNTILKTIQDWHCEDKLFSITLDNASNNGAMSKLLKANLLQKNLLLGEGKLLHQRCAAHVLNLICQSGLKAIDSIVINIRESIKYIRGSQTRKEKFEEIMAQVGVTVQKRPCSDVPTRWNTTYLMIESALPFRQALDSLALQDKNYKYKPSSLDWEKATAVCGILKVLYVATNVISGQLYPTSNLHFHEIWDVKVILEKQASVYQENSRISKMLKSMKKKFQKYWKISWLALSLPVVLDPRFKLKFLEFRFRSAFGDDAESMINNVKTVFRELFNEYSQVNSTIDLTGSADVDMGVSTSDRLADWDQHLNHGIQMTTEICSEYEGYMDKPPIPRSDHFDILNWWQANASEYPTFASMARDILAIPASTVPSESAFSTGRRVISDFRSRLTPNTVEALVCLQDWIRGSGSSNLSTSSIYDFPAEDELVAQ